MPSSSASAYRVQTVMGGLTDEGRGGAPGRRADEAPRHIAAESTRGDGLEMGGEGPLVAAKTKARDLAAYRHRPDVGSEIDRRAEHVVRDVVEGDRPGEREIGGGGRVGQGKTASSHRIRKRGGRVRHDHGCGSEHRQRPGNGTHATSSTWGAVPGVLRALRA